MLSQEHVFAAVCFSNNSCDDVLTVAPAKQQLASQVSPVIKRRSQIVALIPDENAATVIRCNKGLKDYLNQKLGKEIELVVTRLLLHDRENPGANSTIVSTSDCTSDRCPKRAGQDLPRARAANRLIRNQRQQDLNQSLSRIGNTEAGVTGDFEAIKGKTFAFANPASTSSRHVPGMSDPWKNQASPSR